MNPDSFTVQAAAALILFAAGIFAWRRAAVLRPSARLYLRFAAVLAAALAAAVLARLGDVAALFLLPLAAAALALSALARFARPLHTGVASAVLLLALAGGFGALLSGLAMLSLLPAVIASLAIVAAALNRAAWREAVSGMALMTGVMACAQSGTGAGMLLLMAAALVGQSAFQSAFQQQAAARRGMIIGGVG